jgi:cell division protein FtsN
MLGARRRITSRVLAVFVFVSVIFLYFLINNTQKAVEKTDFDKRSGNVNDNYPKKSHIDLVVVEEHHEGRLFFVYIFM